MKQSKLFLTSLITLCVSFAAQLSAENEHIKNAEKPVISVSGDTTTFNYEHYVVTMEKGQEGDRIVVQNKSGGEPYEFCEVDMNAYFYGIYDKYMFIKSSGGLFPTLLGFNLVELDMDPYEEYTFFEGGASIDGSKLTVYSVMEYAPEEVKKKLSKKASKIEDEGFTVFYFQKAVYDYATQEKTMFDEFDCAGANF